MARDIITPGDRDSLTGATGTVNGGGSLHGFPGLMAPSHPSLGPGNLTVTANRTYLCRFMPPRDMTFRMIRHGLNTAATVDDQIDLGIMDIVGTRMVSTGAMSGKLTGAAGPKQTTITATTCSANTPYWAVFSHGAIGGVAALVAGLQAVSFALAGLFTATPNTPDRNSLYLVKDGLFPIPASLSIPSCVHTGGGVPAIALTE